MRLTVAGVGRLKDGPERALFDRYWGRLEGIGRNVGMAPIAFIEIPEGKAAGKEQRRCDEAARLIKSLGDCEFRIAMDEHGKSMSSKAFARMLQDKIDHGTKSACLLLGGPDGHDPTLIEAAHFKLSLGAMTLPHGLARIVLAEQLYRAASILAGHPYHRD